MKKKSDWTIILLEHRAEFFHTFAWNLGKILREFSNKIFPFYSFCIKRLHFKALATARDRHIIPVLQAMTLSTRSDWTETITGYLACLRNWITVWFQYTSTSSVFLPWENNQTICWLCKSCVFFSPDTWCRFMFISTVLSPAEHWVTVFCQRHLLLEESWAVLESTGQELAQQSHFLSCLILILLLIEATEKCCSAFKFFSGNSDFLEDLVFDFDTLQRMDCAVLCIWYVPR